MTSWSFLNSHRLRLGDLRGTQVVSPKQYEILMSPVHGPRRRARAAGRRSSASVHTPRPIARSTVNRRLRSATRVALAGSAEPGEARPRPRPAGPAPGPGPRRRRSAGPSRPLPTAGAFCGRRRLLRARCPARPRRSDRADADGVPGEHADADRGDRQRITGPGSSPGSPATGPAAVRAPRVGPVRPGTEPAVDAGGTTPAGSRATAAA